MDKLKVYSGMPYSISEKLTVFQPSLGDIRDYGEQNYFSLIRTVCATPADEKVRIWDTLHVYWDEVDEYELFLSTVLSLQKIDVSIIFGDLDFNSFDFIINPAGEKCLRNKDGVVFDRATHVLITDFLRQVHRFEKNIDVGYNDYTKDIMIEDDRDEQAKWARKGYDSQLWPLISSLTNCSEFKYRFDDVWTLPIGVFMDAVARIHKLQNYNFVMHGIYNGCVDMKKINNKKDVLNWMGELK